jgi:hypothetical protein
MFSAIIMAGGVDVLFWGSPVHYIPLSLPHPYGICSQDRELARKAQERLDRLVLEPDQIAPTLVRENLAAEYPMDWCAPRYGVNELRGSIVWWRKDDIWSRPRIVDPKPLIARRPNVFVPLTVHVSLGQRIAPVSRSVTPAPSALLPPRRPKGL